MKKPIFIAAFLILLTSCTSADSLTRKQFGNFSILVPGEWKELQVESFDGGVAEFLLPSNHSVFMHYGALSNSFGHRFPLDENHYFVDSIRTNGMIVFARIGASIGELTEFFVERDGNPNERFSIGGSGLNYEEEGVLFSLLRTIQFVGESNPAER